MTGCSIGDTAGCTWGWGLPGELRSPCCHPTTRPRIQKRSLGCIVPIKVTQNTPMFVLVLVFATLSLIVEIISLQERGWNCVWAPLIDELYILNLEQQKDTTFRQLCTSFIFIFFTDKIIFIEIYKEKRSTITF